MATPGADLEALARGLIRVRFLAVFLAFAGLFCYVLDVSDAGPALTRYLDDGRLEIDNGVAERALRGVALGRRNWLFAGSQAGGERAATLYTVIETAKANGVEPERYIADITAKLAAGWPASRWDELMPWNWQPPQPPLAQAA